MDECEVRWMAVEYAVLFDRYWDSDSLDERERIMQRMECLREEGGEQVRDRGLELLLRHGKGPRYVFTEAY